MEIEPTETVAPPPTIPAPGHGHAAARFNSDVHAHALSDHPARCNADKVDYSHLSGTLIDNAK
ncbi:MAG: hypothetical protein KA586_10040 [Candidatus Promineofilum sp.]|nr:hypothetical protein [Promineifilum sp.]